MTITRADRDHRATRDRLRRAGRRLGDLGNRVALLQPGAVSDTDEIRMAAAVATIVGIVTGAENTTTERN